MTDINFSSLVKPPPARAVAAWRECVRREDRWAERHGPASEGPRLAAPVWVPMLAIGAALLCLLFAGTALGMLLTGDDSGWVGLLVTIGLAAAVAVVLLVVLRWRVTAVASGWEEHYQLMAFANDNGFDAAPVAEGGDLPGRIFGRGLAGNRVRHDVVAWTQGGRSCHVATESWHSGNPPDGGLPEDHGSCRYLAVLLAAEDLQPLEFRGGRTVPTQPGAGEVAAVVLTPQVQALLAVPTAPWEAEVAGPWFLAYQPEAPDPLDVATWQRMFALVEALPPYPVAAPA
ncbi:hypothetical protein [Ornithinimicrobium murale]|uniref:hypothetical protein n=1 Tax=Ornithinimicrobium murale TaxID=1050153 RepID=UPI000E0DBBD3|nr:hypothetical protein [Ornithinimicrobium murale]